MSPAAKRAAHYRYLERECLRLADIEDSTDMSTPSKRAAHYRYMEAECRRLAEIEDSLDIPNNFLQMAEDYSSRAEAEEPDTLDHVNGC